MPGNSICLHNFGQGKRTESEKMPFRAIISSPCSASAFQSWKKREVIHSDRQRASLDQSIKNGGQSILRKAKETVRNGGALWLVVFWPKIETTLMRFKLFSIKSQCSPNPNVRPLINQCFSKNLSYHQYSPNYLPINNQHDVWPWLALKDEDGKNLQLTWIFDAPPSCLSSRKIQ